MVDNFYDGKKRKSGEQTEDASAISQEIGDTVKFIALIRHEEWFLEKYVDCCSSGTKKEKKNVKFYREEPEGFFCYFS